MNATQYLLAANVAIWIGMGAYLVFMAKKQHNLQTRLKQLEMLHDERD